MFSFYSRKFYDILQFRFMFYRKPHALFKKAYSTEINLQNLLGRSVSAKNYKPSDGSGSNFSPLLVITSVCLLAHFTTAPLIAWILFENLVA